MRLALRLACVLVFSVTLLVWALRRYIENELDQERLGSYIVASVKISFHHRHKQHHISLTSQASLDSDGHDDDSPARLVTTTPLKGDKVIVMAKLEKEDTRWVAEELPDWQSAIYTVNPSHPRDLPPNPHYPPIAKLPSPVQSITNTSTLEPDFLTTPRNKGREALAYLTYLIDNYASPTLPAVITFLHSHRSGYHQAWHVDTPLHSNVDALRMLNLPYVQSQGYVNLRCNHNPGCLASHTINEHVTPQVWAEVFAGTSFPVAYAPEKVGAACCAQFAVSREQVRARPLEDYVRLRDWVLRTEMSDARSGRVMEFLWHVVFGRESVHCPPERECYCNVYARCEESYMAI